MEELVKKSKTEPNKYVQVDDDTVIWGYLDGKQTPIECPCNHARKFEDWIWNHRHIIAPYFRERLAIMKMDLAYEERDLDPELMKKVERS